MVEGPLAATLADADEIVELDRAARAGGRFVAYGENLLAAPAVAEAVAGRRRIGAATYLEVRFAQGRPGWRGRPDVAWGGGVLFDLGVHAIALELLLAAPAKVVGVEAVLERAADLEVDDEATATLIFDTGLRATVRASWRAPAPVWDAQAATDTGAVRLELVPRPVVELNGVAVRLGPEPAGLPSAQLHHLGYVGQLAALVADVEARRGPRAPVDLGRTVLDIVCAAYRAAGTEAVPFAGPRDRTPHELWQHA
jgi:predicted dehydrogenase